MTAFITVQTGPRNARTDPETGLRFYTWQGRELPSVTSIRRMAGLPFGLHNWSIGRVIDAAVEAGPEITAATDAAQLQVLRSRLRSAATAERDAAAALGTAVHDAAATGRAIADVDPELQPRLRQFYSWQEASRAEVLASEFQVWNLTVGYAGTVDALIRFPNGQVWLVDYKTSKGTYSEHALQLVAYRMAEFAGADNVIDEDLTALLRSVSGIALLHLADDGWEFQAVRLDQETWMAFCGLLEFAVWMATHPNVGSVLVGKRNGSAA